MIWYWAQVALLVGIGALFGRKLGEVLYNWLKRADDSACGVYQCKKHTK